MNNSTHDLFKEMPYKAKNIANLIKYNNRKSK